MGVPPREEISARTMRARRRTSLKTKKCKDEDAREAEETDEDEDDGENDAPDGLKNVRKFSSRHHRLHDIDEEENDILTRGSRRPPPKQNIGGTLHNAGGGGGGGHVPTTTRPETREMSDLGAEDHGGRKSFFGIDATTTTTTTGTPPSPLPSSRGRNNTHGGSKEGKHHQRFVISWKKIARNVAPFCVLSVQYGAQPLLTKKFISANVSSLGVVAATECVKIALCLISMRMQGPREIRRQFGKVRLNVFALSVVPAIVYSIQNMLMQYGYHSVDPVLFNCLNQTKIIWTALFVYVVFGTKQTFVQCLSLFGLMLASVILQIKEILEPAVDAQKSLGSSGDVNGADASGMTVIAEEEYARYLGVIAVTAASCLSGLASTSTQISLQALRRSAQVLTIEMAIASIPIVYFVHVSKLAFGDELFVQQAQPHLHEEQDEAAATPTPTGNLVSSAAIQRLLYAGSTKWSSMFDNFTFLTFIPIFTSAIGGICVGLVTKNLGSVAKGFAITLGLILTGVIESVTRGEMLQTEQIVGLLLVGACTHAHTVYAAHEPLVTNSQIRIAQANAERRDRQKKRIRDQSAKKFA